MLKALQECRVLIGRLFNKSFTVHTATQSRQSREKQQEASDEAIVVMILRESAKERRASVIWSNYFRTTLMIEV